MSQFLVNPNNISKDRFCVYGQDAHHLLRVLRKKADDSINLFDGEGHRYKAEITRLDPEKLLVEGKILETLNLEDSRGVEFHLFQGLPRGAKFDYVIEKATELGVNEITPFLSEKSLIKLSSTQAAQKLPRWHKIIRAASQQSNRSLLPVIHPVAPFSSLAQKLGQGTTLVLWEKEEPHTLKSLLAELSKKKINIIVGPESGLSQQEVENLVSQGAKKVSLGSLTLRTETAGLAMLSILSFELGLM